MTLSYSALKQYETCPRQYHEVRVLKLHPKQETEATRWGAAVHEAAEFYVRDGKEFEFDFPGQDMVKALAALQGDKYCELEMAVNDRLEPVEFSDPTAVLRGIADFALIKGARARVADYKTGGAKYPDVAQLELMSLMLFTRFPEVETSHGALLFLAHDTMVQKITKKSEAERLWSVWFGKVERIEQAHRTGVWNAKPSGLCNGWCPCTRCEHWKERR